MEYKELRVQADLGAEKALAAEKAGCKIAVEIKVLDSPSPISELERAIGQYGVYRSILKRIDPQRKLFLAIALRIVLAFYRPERRAITEFAIA